MLILHRYMLRESLVATISSLAVFLAVISALFLAELLGDAAQGEVPAASVVLLLVLRLPEAIMMVGPLALLVGLLLALGRMHEQSEMTVVRVGGAGFTRCFAPVLVLVAAWAAMLMLVAGWVAPYAVERGAEVMTAAARQALVAGLQPGQFERFDGGRLTVYVGGFESGDDELTEILIQHADPDRPELITAAAGRLWMDPADGSRYLSLIDGHQIRHGPDPAGSPLHELRFARNDIRLPMPDSGARLDPEMIARLPALLRPLSPDQRRELQWRLAPSLAALVLGVLAVPLSYRSPRQGRWGSLVLALGLYLIYSNAIQGGLVMMEQRSAMTGPGLWPIHGGLAMAAWGLWLRQRRRW
ncbi:MAG: LPS export ABC transporter permease LptF [Wenzhouxiangellaceae bacterium]|nr:MAG: LPS export ABC transporter permease LptF [Wenzhouxiangellaceae bacterium]